MMKNNLMGFAAQPGIENSGGARDLEGMSDFQIANQNAQQNSNRNANLGYGAQAQQPTQAQGVDPVEVARRRQQQRRAQQQYMGTRPPQQIQQQAQMPSRQPTAAGEYRSMMMQSAKNRYMNSATPRYNPYRQDGTT